MPLPRISKLALAQDQPSRNCFYTAPGEWRGIGCSPVALVNLEIALAISAWILQHQSQYYTYAQELGKNTVRMFLCSFVYLIIHFLLSCLLYIGVSACREMCCWIKATKRADISNILVSGSKGLLHLVSKEFHFQPSILNAGWAGP